MPDAFQNSGSAASRDAKDTIKQAAGDALSKAASIARDTTTRAKQVASDATSTVSEHVLEMLDKQIGTSVNVASQFANSARLAADNLDAEAPFVAGLVRNFASKIDDMAEGFQDQSVEAVMRTASDFTRRQPALVFGVAAVAGFFLMRTLKYTKEIPSPSIQSAQDEEQTPRHG